MKRFLFLAGLVVGLITFTSCDSGTEPDDNDGEPQNECATLAEGEDVKITYPAGGESFNYGDTVNIAFTAVKEIETVNIKISLNGGAIYRNLITEPEGFTVPLKGDVRCGEYTWVIGTEGEMVDYMAENTECVIKVQKYGNPQMAGLSETFTVIKN